jgi:hypothetical protein
LSTGRQSHASCSGTWIPSPGPAGDTAVKANGVNRGRDFFFVVKIGALSQDRVAYRREILWVCGTTRIWTTCLALTAIALLHSLFFFFFFSVLVLGNLTWIFRYILSSHPHFTLPCNATHYLVVDVEHRTPLLRRKWDGSDLVRSLAHVMRNIVLQSTGLLA